MPLPVTLADVERARKVLAEPMKRGVIRETPTIRSESLSEATGGEVYLKLENLQATGSYKVRGAYTKIASLTEAERARGIIAASAGNHAQGVALAARDLGVKATICMPEDAPIPKVTQTRRLGAEVVLIGRDYNEAAVHAKRLEKERGMTFVHPFDDPLTIAGQGTAGLEMMEAVPDADIVIVAVGGGGLISGIATAVKGLRPQAKVIGVEPTGAAALHGSLKAGKRIRLDRVDTIADGLATRETGVMPYEICKELLDDVVLVDDGAIANAILHLLEREKLVAEGAGAAATAALLERKVDVRGKRVIVLVSGGNIDVTLIEHIIERGLVRAGRILKFDVPLSDRPGALRDLLDVLAKAKANVIGIEHSRRRADVGVRQALVRVEVETRGSEHTQEVVKALAGAGYMVSVEG